MRFEVQEQGNWFGHYELVLGGSKDRYRLKHEQAEITRADRSATERFVTRDGVVQEAPEGLDRPAPDRSNLTFPKLGATNASLRFSRRFERRRCT